MSSAKRYYAAIKDDRYDWADRMPQRCMKCFKRFEGFVWREIHEIEKRSQAPLNWAHRCNYLSLCHDCHGDMDSWTHAQQLALKLRMDPKHFDLEAWLAIKPRPVTYLTIDEIRRAA